MNNEKPKLNPEEYREGNVDENLPKQEEPSKEVAANPDAPKIETAFIVVKYENGAVDVITDVSGFPHNRQPILPEVHDMCIAGAANINRILQARVITREISNAMAQTQMQSQVNMMKQQMIDAQGGRGPGPTGVPRPPKKA